MVDDISGFLKERLDEDQYARLAAVGNDEVDRFVVGTIELCDPASVYVCTGTESSAEYIKREALARKEEMELATPGHTIHFDGIRDQARDKENTKYLLPPDVHLGKHINYTVRGEGLDEVRQILEGCMSGQEMIVLFFCLGPKSSVFTQLACQITDSFYVAHSEHLLYRPGYDDFKAAGSDAQFFRFLHSSGELEGGVSKNTDKRRVYIDLKENTVYSVNTQYGGNTMGLKKLAMRLGVSKSLREGWLTEHMFIVGVKGRGGRTTYVTGAFPSLCGKTSTAMIPGQTIVGDDIAYLKKIDGEVRAVNVERGIFGIILDVNPTDDPVIYRSLTSPGELIFSNVLIKDGLPYWLGMGKELPDSGVNFAGEWKPGMEDGSGAQVDPSHKNARFTIRIDELENCDPHLDDPDGVPIGGIIFGGRDSDTCVPVEQSFDWPHGVVTKGASLESETTAATLGKEGVRKFNPMSNLDFLAASLDTYLQKYMEFAEGLTRRPLVFGVNYFIKGADGEYLNGMMDKKVWMQWIEARINGDVDALETPTGLIPLYRDIRAMFKEYLDKDFTEEQYREQFTVRVPEQLQKLERIEAIYRQEYGIPEVVFRTLDEQGKRLESARERYGDYITPLTLSQQ